MRRMPSRLAGVVTAAISWLSLTLPALAASPGPTTGAGGDPRSSGQGPGLVGDPLLAVLAVVAIGAAALGLTLIFVRLTGRHSA